MKTELNISSKWLLWADKYETLIVNAVQKAVHGTNVFHGLAMCVCYRHRFDARVAVVTACAVNIYLPSVVVLIVC